ncbi:hypothetical protein GJ744_000734 [Endocarpon pusillum]|uniref:Uncharacterized protein n=1 Tax=Endocarpon pusillum TaxID=364733 RepID=A0A8H7AD14_9EURO|nr:hypothetical protein GJ744_000734 [Endocarpon pusillum]
MINDLRKTQYSGTIRVATSASHPGILGVDDVDNTQDMEDHSSAFKLGKFDYSTNSVERGFREHVEAIERLD